MKPIYLTLEDGAVFEGRSVNDALDTVGLLSFYTGVVGYQEVITDPANCGKILMFTYPLIGNAGVNSTDAESNSPMVNGVIVKEYPRYFSNFRAEGNLADYLAPCGVVFGEEFDTRAILVHLRDHGEMMAVVSERKLSSADVKKMVESLVNPVMTPQNKPVPNTDAKIKAAVVDFGASRSFYSQLATLGIDATCKIIDADIVIVSDAPYYSVEDEAVIDRVRELVGKKTIIGFGHGLAITAKACGGDVVRMNTGHHGVNIPVRYIGGGRNEITVQNHIYTAKLGNGIEPLFENIHDGSCEGFIMTDNNAAGTNFIPNTIWLEAILEKLGVA